MEKKILSSDENGTAVELIVRGRKVTALFPPQPNPQIYERVKQIMADACAENF